MKSFLKYTLATITGFIIVNIIILFILMGIIGGLASLGEQTVEVKDNSLLIIKLNSNIPDKASTNPLSNIDFISMKQNKSIGLNQILESIKKAAKDDRIKGIYLQLNSDVQSNFGGMGTTYEIRSALQEFKKSEKFIYSYSNLGYSQKSYYLASVADSVFVNPETPLILMGMGGTSYFYKDMFDKIGIKAEIVKVGKYKSAVEPFTQTEMSEANRIQIETYLKSIWGNIVNGISEARHISPDTINWLANNLEIRSTKEEETFGLYDDIVYEDQMLDFLKEKCGVSANDKLNTISLSDYQKTPSLEKFEVIKDKIAVIYAQGEIGMESTEGGIGPELAVIIRKAREDKNIKAIVLRVNSPGGSALTSDIIWREVDLAAKAKPLIASMGNVAASGGYYISCAADTILADPTTLTGSIGIYGQFFEGEKLIKDKIGITSSVVKTNEYSDFGGGHPLFLPINSRPLTPYERNVLQKYIERGYETFLNRVAVGRHMTRDQVHEVAQGRVWTGEDALKVGLVDVLGGLEEAVKIAAEKANLTKYKITEYPIEKNPFEELFSNFSASMKAKMLENELGEYYDTFNNIKNIVNTQQGIICRIPYEITLN